MIKIIRNLIKSNSDYKRKYFVAYRIDSFQYDYQYCYEAELKSIIEKYGYENIHIFLTKDELEFENQFILNKVDEDSDKE